MGKLLALILCDFSQQFYFKVLLLLLQKGGFRVTVSRFSVMSMGEHRGDKDTSGVGGE